MRCWYYSSPVFNDGYGDANVIRNNSNYGVEARYYSNPNLNKGYYGIGNSVKNNTMQELDASFNCTITARNVWWGNYPPLDSKFSLYHPTLDRSNPLQSDPYPSRTVLTGSDQVEALISTLNKNMSIQGGEDLDRALDRQKDKKYDEAIPLFLEVFESNKDALVGKFALIKIEECFTQAGKKDFLDYSKKELRPLIKTSTETFVVLLELETHQLVNAGSYKQAMDNLFLIKDKYNLNEEIDKNTLYRIGVFYSDLYGDKKNAQKYFDEFKTKYPKDYLVNNIDRWLNTTDFESKNGNYIAILQTGEGSEVARQSSVSVENYPNPFNPTTKISFSIPQKSQIKLKVFDILGREITLLADGVYEAGKHEVSFDAGNLSSGVYFYNLTTGSNSISKKMLLVK